MFRTSVLLASVATFWLVCHTHTAFADKRHVSRGYFAEAGAGAMLFLGDAANYARVGPGFEFRTGYDLTSWLAFGVEFGASTHEATVPPPPEGEYFQLYHATADARLGYVFGAIGIYVEGGAGVAMMSSNILGRVGILDPGEQFSLALRGGGGLEYQLRNRHYAIGLGGQWLSTPGFNSTQGVSTRLYLRYTY